MNFVDLFAGLGGFHLALKRLGHNCVFASEIDPELASLYERNFGIVPSRDIREVKLEEIFPHDILCAGFPCQPFSKAGSQEGLNCPHSGDLINYIVNILHHHKPKYFIIENVPNLISHNEGKTWESIKLKLLDAGYDFEDRKMSPHQFGVPQIRERIFIVGQRSCLENFNWPTPSYTGELSIKSVLDKNPNDARKLPQQYILYLETWQRFLDKFPNEEQLPAFPIWAMEFGATYPYEDKTPYSKGFKKLGSSLGSFGRSLKFLKPNEVKNALPPYAQERVNFFPSWKVEYIRKNRDFYKKYKHIISPWLPSIQSFPPSFQKLEWNCKKSERNIWKHVIQFRASGIRVRKTTTAPTLVAMARSQVPVIGWERRFMTPVECSRLQSMSTLKYLPFEDSIALRALGNAVNVDVVEAIARELLPNLNSIREEIHTRNNCNLIKNSIELVTANVE